MTAKIQKYLEILKENWIESFKKCLHAYIKLLEMPLNKEILQYYCLHKPYIKPT
jgi:hypothetical protein